MATSTVSSIILNKRISKFRKTTKLSPQEGSENIIQCAPYTKSQKVARCRFKQIPQSTKFGQMNSLYPLLGDIPLKDSQNGVSMDISLYNHFKHFTNVTVTDFFEEKVIMVRPTSNNDKILNSQIAVADRLNEIKSFDRDEWNRVITTFYQKYDKVMKRQTHKKTKCDVRKKFYAKITSKTVEKKRVLFEKYPCAELQFRVRNHQSQLNDIVFGDKFLKELGYSDESFISTVLKEGIPQLMTSDAAFSEEIKLLIDNYFQINNDGFESPINRATLLLKSGYVKDVKYQMHVLMNYETNTFGMDVVMAIVDQSEPYLPKHPTPMEEINESFIKEMIVRENEIEYLLSSYYDETIQKWYTNIDKTCKIKEIHSLE